MDGSLLCDHRLETANVITVELFHFHVTRNMDTPTFIDL